MFVRIGNEIINTNQIIIILPTKKANSKNDYTVCMRDDYDRVISEQEYKDLLYTLSTQNGNKAPILLP